MGSILLKKVENGNIFSLGVVALEIKRDYYLQKLIAKKHSLDM